VLSEIKIIFVMGMRSLSHTKIWGFVRLFSQNSWHYMGLLMAWLMGWNK